MSHQSGIYKITNIVSGKFYIGSSENIERRWGVHKSRLKGNYHINNHFQRAWDKYGEQAFKFEVLEYCSKESCIEREQYYLDTLKPFGKIGYNIARFADASSKGMHHNKKIREKISKNHADVSGQKNPSYGRKKSTSEINKISKNHADVSGEKNPNYGIKASKEKLKRMSAGFKKQEKQQCIYCGRYFYPQNLNQWHNEKCTMRNK